jgi:PadR family transcriptional regulator, regulatory protein AphA
MDVKTLCLAVLSKGDASGYEIKKAFEEGPFAHFQTASFGAIYPALARLSEAGMVVQTDHPQDGKPDKKMYRLTTAGQDALFATLEISPGPDQIRSDFLFLLFFAEHLPPARIRTLVDARIAFFREALAHMDELDAAGPCDLGHGFVRGFGRTVYQAAMDYLTANGDKLVASVAVQHRQAAD